MIKREAVTNNIVDDLNSRNENWDKLETMSNQFQSIVDGEIQAVLDSEIIRTDIADKLLNIETEYAPRLTTAETNIALLRNQVSTYGLRWKISTDTYTRIENAVGKVANIGDGVNDFNSIMPWAGMRRCNIPDDFVITVGNRTSYKVNAYYGEPGYTEDGSNGQVMVEVPAFYYKTVVIDSDTIEWYISMLPIAGYILHPWFYDINGNPVNKKHFSAYEGSIYDVSTGTYLLADEQVADFTTTTGDKLCSIAGAKPCSGAIQDLNIVKSRILANNRGSGWQQQYFNASSAIQLLFAIEYASFNSQAKLGGGVTNITDDGTTNMSINTGLTSSLGNKSGSVSIAHYQTSQATSTISYRGIENFYGNMWTWVDGFNINNGFAYISNINGNFISNKFDGQYVNVGELPRANGYMSKPLLNQKLNFNHGFIPAEALGTSSKAFADNYWQNPVGAFVARLGGSWSYGSTAGAFNWALNTGSGSRVRNVGARLCA